MKFGERYSPRRPEKPLPGAPLEMHQLFWVMTKFGVEDRAGAETLLRRLTFQKLQAQRWGGVVERCD